MNNRYPIHVYRSDLGSLSGTSDMLTYTSYGYYHKTWSRTSITIQPREIKTIRNLYAVFERDMEI